MKMIIMFLNLLCFATSESQGYSSFLFMGLGRLIPGEGDPEDNPGEGTEGTEYRHHHKATMAVAGQGNDVAVFSVSWKDVHVATITLVKVPSAALTEDRTWVTHNQLSPKRSLGNLKTLGISRVTGMS